MKHVLFTIDTDGRIWPINGDEKNFNGYAVNDYVNRHLCPDRRKENYRDSVWSLTNRFILSLGSLKTFQYLNSLKVEDIQSWQKAFAEVDNYFGELKALYAEASWLKEEVSETTINLLTKEIKSLKNCLKRKIKKQIKARLGEAILLEKESSELLLKLS